VLKLHRDATSAPARIIGRLENMDSGRHFDFGSADELLARLIEDMSSTVQGVAL
jgi:hypothetical protein